MTLVLRATEVHVCAARLSDGARRWAARDPWTERRVGGGVDGSCTIAARAVGRSFVHAPIGRRCEPVDAARRGGEGEHPDQLPTPPHVAYPFGSPQSPMLAVEQVALDGHPELGAFGSHSCAPPFGHAFSHEETVCLFTS